MQIGQQNWPYLNKSLGFNIPEFDRQHKRTG